MIRLELPPEAIGPRGQQPNRRGNVLTVSRIENHDQTVEALGDLCRRADPLGITVCLEYMRITQVASLADALGVIAECGEPNAALLIDLLHVFRSDGSIEELATVDPALLTYAQWCDGPAQPADGSPGGLLRDALDHRSIPGDGALPVMGFLEVLPDQLPLSLEIRSEALRKGFPDHTARAAKVLDATLAMLALSATTVRTAGVARRRPRMHRPIAQVGKECTLLGQ